MSTEFKANLTRFVSKITESQVGISGGVEWHDRGGKKIGVKRPDGFIQIGSSRTVVLGDKDSEGKRISRYVMNKPPKGFTIVSAEELETELNRIINNIPRVGGMES
jgi:hypothetical protein